MKKILCLALLLYLINLQNIIYADNSEDLKKVFADLRLMEPLPDVNYIYLPKEKGEYKEYEGRLNKIKLTIHTYISNDKEKINVITASIPGEDGEQYLSIISSYFGKPQEKKNIYTENGTPMIIYHSSFDNYEWMFIVGPGDCAILATLKEGKSL